MMVLTIDFDVWILMSNGKYIEFANECNFQIQKKQQKTIDSFYSVIDVNLIYPVFRAIM